jgi:copper chaperone CopZ
MGSVFRKDHAMNRFVSAFFIAALAGCAQPNSESTVSTSDETTAVAFNVAGAPTVEFNVPDMMCPEGCGAKTKEILSEQPGAKEVVINFDGKTATVAVEKDKFDADAAIAALVDYGFEHSTLKSDSRATDATESLGSKPAG